jgi:hypothetical protein
MTEEVKDFMKLLEKIVRYPIIGFRYIIYY